MEPELDTLECGCRVGLVGDAFIFLPHDLMCWAYLYVLDQAAAQGKPVVVVGDPDE